MNRKIMNKIQTSFPYFLLSLVLVCVLFLVFIPMVERSLERTVQRKVTETAAGFGLKLNRVQVVSLGVTGAHFRDVRIGKLGENKLILPDIHVSYTISGILKRKISAVHVVGLTIHAQIDRDGTVRISGLPPLSTFAAHNKDQTKTDDSLPPIPDIFLDNAFVFLKSPYGSLLIPGSLVCKFDGNTLTLQTDLFPEGGTVQVKGKFELPALDGNVNISWEGFGPDRFIGQLVTDKSMSFSGTLSGKASITLAKGKPTAGSIEADTKNAHVSISGTSLTLDAHFSTRIIRDVPEDIRLSATVYSLISEKMALAAPATIQLDGKTLDMLDFSAPKVRIQTPIPGTVSLSGQLLNMTETPAVQGQYTLRLPPNATSAHLPGLPSITVPVKIRGKFTGNTERKLPHFTLSANASQPLSLSMAKGKLDMGTVAVNATLSGNPQNAKFSAIVSAKNLTGTSKKTTVKGDRFSLQVAGKLEEAGLKLTSTKGEFSDFNLDDGNGNQVAGFSGKARFKKNPGENSGSFTAEKTVTPDISFSHVHGTWKPVKNGISFEGGAELPVHPLVLTFEGEFDSARENDIFAMDFHLPQTALPEGTDLGPLISSLKGFSVTGKVAMAGRIAISKDSSPMATAELEVHNMALATKDGNMKITGVESSIEFNNLLSMNSRPSQLATIQKISAGPAALENAQIRFQLLDADTVSVESAEFAFAEGEMSVSSFLLSTAKPDMDFGIYCNQLKLTSLLNLAMGEGKAKGDGTVSGYIPLRLVDGNLVFGKGFLQSVPGNAGTIQIADSKDITGGVVLAEEAVKDFTYQWARVNLESRNGNLNLLLKLDGKPNRKLPLIYDQEAGDFVRDPQNRRLVSLQGLTLDLNFVDIDINRLLKQQGKVKFRSK
jgi:hypothetical protein